MNIDIESCVDDEYDWSPRGEIHKESAWANSGGKDGYALFWNVIEIDDRAFQNKEMSNMTHKVKSFNSKRVDAFLLP